MLQKVYNQYKIVNIFTPDSFKLVCSVKVINSVGGKNE